MSERPEIAQTGCIPEDLRSIRRVPTLMGNKTEEGNDYVDLPRWFTRTGVRTCEIDTGVGTVTLKAGSFSDKELEGDSGYTRLLELIVDHPAWEAEYDITIKVKGNKPDIVVPRGGPIPDVETILACKNHAVSKDYVEECFPPSILQQAMTAQYFLRLPPIAYMDPQQED